MREIRVLKSNGSWGQKGHMLPLKSSSSGGDLIHRTYHWLGLPGIYSGETLSAVDFPRGDLKTPGSKRKVESTPKSTRTKKKY